MRVISTVACEQNSHIAADLSIGDFGAPALAPPREQEIGAMLKAVDYDDKQHAGYVQGRDWGPDHARQWVRIFEAHAPAQRPLTVLDLGSGTGRFTGVLAEVFGGEAIGVEPAGQMRRIAMERKDNPGVRFVSGRAEAIPLADASVDIVLMFLSLHHVKDREAAAAEVSRVLRPDGRLFIRSAFSHAERPGDLDWHVFFPGARRIEIEMFPTLEEVEALFEAVGLCRTALIQTREQVAETLEEQARRLRFRAISTFEHMTEDEIEAGFARLDAAVAKTPLAGPVCCFSDLLVLGRY
jgi:ubiquinone/menaquinone biosynthesis C-methylase UbiE